MKKALSHLDSNVPPYFQRPLDVPDAKTLLKHSGGTSPPNTHSSPTPIDAHTNLFGPFTSAPSSYEGLNNVMNAEESPFSSPLETLAMSLQASHSDSITTHDLIEAYSLLYFRIRSQSAFLRDSDRAHAAAMHMKKHSATITGCLQRDIHAGLSFSPRESSCRTSPLNTFSDITLAEDEVQHSRDFALLCQNALRLVSLFFALPVFHSLFSVQELSKILREIVALGRVEDIPTVNAHKTCALVFCTLQSQNLPRSVLSLRIADIVGSLKHAIQQHAYGEPAKLDAFKAIRRILSGNSGHFLRQILELLPLVMEHLVSESVTYRLESAYALSGFVVAKLAILDSADGVHAEISGIVHGFLNDHGKRDRSQTEASLPQILANAISNDDASWNSKGPLWGITVLASLTVLTDGTLFPHPRSVRVVFNALRLCAKPNNTPLLRLHAETWKAAIWAFSRSFVVHGIRDVESRKDIFEKAFCLLEQENKSGIGICLVAALLQDHHLKDDVAFIEGNVTKAIKITKNLAGHQSRKRVFEGLHILDRFVSSIGCPNISAPRAAPSDFFSHILVNGFLLKAPPEAVQEAIRNFELRVDHVRPLAEAEIRAHWQDLAEIWATSIEKLLPVMTSDDLDALVRMWQALLLSQTQLTQGHQHLTTPSPFTARLASFITRFVTPKSDPELQVQQLNLVRKLWNVLKNVFDTSRLPIPAESILAGVLSVQFDFGNERIKALWSELCASLISVGLPTLLHVLHTRAESQEQSQDQLEVTRQLWQVKGRHNLKEAGEKNWGDLAVFLVVPFGASNSSWIFDHAETELWKSVFDAMLSNARKDGVRQEDALSHFLRQLDDVKQDLRIRLSQTSSCLALLFQRVVQSASAPLCSSLLPLVSNTLVRLYSDSTKPVALDILSHLGRSFEELPSSEVISSISVAQQGVCAWLEDRNNLLDDTEHCDLVKSVYCTALGALAGTEASTSTLRTLETFFISVFARITTPAVGPLAFTEFWRKTYHDKADLKKQCPGSIRVCLKAFSDIQEDSLGDGISLGPSSPSTVVSDSQSPINQQMMRNVSHHELSNFPDLEEMFGFGFQVPYHDKGLEDEEEAGTMTPKASSSRSQVPALRALQGYSSTVEATSVPPIPDLPEMHALPYSGSGTKDLLLARRPAKRRLDETNRTPSPSSVAQPFGESQPLRKRSRTTPEAVVQAYSPGRRSSASTKDHSPADAPIIEMEPSFAEGAESVRPPNLKWGSPLPRSEDDYDTWEASISLEDVEEMRRASVRTPVPPDALKAGDGDFEAAEEPSSDAEGDELAMTQDVHRSPSISEFPLRSRQRERSQTAPELCPEPDSASRPFPHAEPLRRHYTSTAQIDALQHAYAVIADAGGVSQIPVEDLMQARRLANRINEVLDDQVQQKLTRRQSKPP